MRRPIIHEGAGQLSYEIREIVGTAKKLERLGVPITWENIGDPIQKGEPFPDWIKRIIVELVKTDASYAYSETPGVGETREFLAGLVNARGGCRVTGDDIVFFNGLGDAVAKIFGFLRREARVIGPSPAYSTHSSAEAAHSGYEHLTYELDPHNGWTPDLDDLENKCRYNDSIAGILLINPDNPTGVVYTRELLENVVEIARRYGLFVICDETYIHIVYGGAETVHLSEVIGDVPGIALRSISKEYPWPGSRCGWMEVYNQDRHPEFRDYIASIVSAKRLEVCSTTLPQLSIPAVMGSDEYVPHLARRKAMFEARAEEAYRHLGSIEGTFLQKPRGAFYLTMMFEDGALSDTGSLPIREPAVASFLEKILPPVKPDKRFVYYLLASTGICVVPLTGFCSGRAGFRATLLETDDEKRLWIWQTLASAVQAYLASCRTGAGNGSTPAARSASR